MGDIDTVQIQEPYHKHIAANNDTTDVLFLTLANDKQVFVGLEELTPTVEKELIKVVDALGREVKDEPRKLLIYVYSDGTTRKVFRID